MDKTDVSYMSIAFHSCITRQNWSNNEWASTNGSKIILLDLNAKGNKNPNLTSCDFLICLSKIKNYSNWTTGSMGFVVPPGSTIYCVCTCKAIFFLSRRYGFTKPCIFTAQLRMYPKAWNYIEKSVKIKEGSRAKMT